MLKFKLRIFRPFRTKDTSTPPEKHPPPPCQRHKVTAVDSTCTTTSAPPPPQPHRSTFKTHLCFAFRCGSTSANHHSASEEDLQSHAIDSPRPTIYDKARIYSPDLPLCTTATKNATKHKKHRLRKPITTASPDSDQFTTKYIVEVENEQQSEVISLSSKSFSTDYSSHRSVRRSREKEGGGGLSPECGSPERLSVFMKLMPCKAKESFAVVKRSENPYEDFKRSMVEMIVEKEMVEEGDLTQLLQCFLSLNSRYHHGVIMEAFSEIWDTMFLDQYRTFGI
ncbi:LOW QUALITY PROTEIN: hypothetical protein OSB04_027366 [Centaurea solstitialis]|uniref:Transcription repressor n=1 Tax=Centaurea solstitialis TaxID=347529 RepID=A0AA38W6S5_9ASTR|nr:LOW QUALITY PROTEIN: hypothetical protein OSB04_027366 [Centaurea solstitialis]